MVYIKINSIYYIIDWIPYNTPVMKMKSSPIFFFHFGDLMSTPIKLTTSKTNSSVITPEQKKEAIYYRSPQDKGLDYCLLLYVYDKTRKTDKPQDKNSGCSEK